MPTLQIRDLPQDLYDQLKTIADESRRSMTKEVISIIEDYIIAKSEEKSRIQRKKAALKRLQNLKPKLAGVTKEDIVKSIRANRDR